jgi:hypothetical protein
MTLLESVSEKNVAIIMVSFTDGLTTLMKHTYRSRSDPERQHVSPDEQNEWLLANFLHNLNKKDVALKHSTMKQMSKY